MTNRDARNCYDMRIEAIQFDINCLSNKKYAKSVKILQEAIEDYKRKRDMIPNNDELRGSL